MYATLDKWTNGEVLSLETIYDVLFNLAFLLIIIGGVGMQFSIFFLLLACIIYKYHKVLGFSPSYIKTTLKYETNEYFRNITLPIMFERYPNIRWPIRENISLILTGSQKGVFQFLVIRSQ